MEKAELIRTAERVRSGWEAALAALGVDGMEQAGATGDWRVRDVLAHCHGWERWQMVQLHCAFSGETPTDDALSGGITYPPNTDMHPDAMNAMFVAGTLRLPTQEIVRLWQEVADMRAEWISAATQEQLDQLVGLDWTGGSARILRLVCEVPAASSPVPVWQFLLEQFKHQEMHLQLVQQWMKTAESAV